MVVQYQAEHLKYGEMWLVVLQISLYILVDQKVALATLMHCPTLPKCCYSAASHNRKAEVNLTLSESDLYEK